MPAEDPAVIERRMYVDMHLNGVDDPEYTLADLRYMGGGGANAHRAATVGNNNAGNGYATSAQGAKADSAVPRTATTALARFLNRAKAGGTVKVVGIGDSVTAGTGATLGTNDFLTLVRNGLAARFPSATITHINRGLSGATVATHSIYGHTASALADAADLYIIAFGKNDTVTDAFGVPVQGYPLAQSMRGLEVMVREIRRKVPQADIILMSEPPNIASDAIGNANLRAWNAKARQISDAYGCEWVDAYAASTALGDYSSMLSDAVHPSVAGHALIANTILAHLPADTITTVSAPGRPGPDGGLYSVADIKVDSGYSGWVVLSGAPGAAQSGVWANSGTWSGSNPNVTTTPTDYAEFTFVGTEFALRMSTSLGDALVVDVQVDGVTTQSNLPMTTIASAFQPFVLLASGLTPLQHKVRVTLKSGTLRIYQAAWRAANMAQENMAPRQIAASRWLGSPNYIPATINPGAGAATVTPFFVPRIRSCTDIACEVTTLAEGATVELGIYGSDEFDQPLGLILSGGTVDASTTGFKSIALAMDARALQPGWYWLASLPLGGAPALRANNGAQPDQVSTSANTMANALNGYRATGLATLPARWTATLAVAASPRVVVKFN